MEHHPDSGPSGSISQKVVEAKILAQSVAWWQRLAGWRPMFTDIFTYADIGCLVVI